MESGKWQMRIPLVVLLGGRNRLCTGVGPCWVMVMHTFNSSTPTQRQRQADILEVYGVRSRPDKRLHRENLSQKNKEGREGLRLELVRRLSS